ncbi:hypothetical protein ACOSP7_019672 [Xanthoceras sorbifolium]
MLEVGNGGMKYTEYVVHFSIWAISKAPLLLGCDVRNITKETMQIISNQEVIAVNQGPLSGNRIVVLFENRKPWTSMMTAHWDDIGINFNNTFVEARDLWEYQTLETKFQGKLTARVEPHACKMFVLTPITRFAKL